MQKMLDVIDNAISEKYEEIRQSGKIIAGIRDLGRQIRFNQPELAAHVEKRMLKMAEEKGDLP